MEDESSIPSSARKDLEILAHDDEILSNNPQICYDMIALVASHCSVSDIKKLMNLSKTSRAVIFKERSVMRKILFILCIPHVKENDLQFIEEKRLSVRNLKIQTEKSYVNILVLILNQANNLEEFRFQCTQLLETVNWDESEKRIMELKGMKPMIPTSINLRDLSYMYHLKKLSFSFGIVNDAVKNEFLKLMQMALYRGKHLEEFFFECLDLKSNVKELYEDGFDQSDLIEMLSLKKVSLKFKGVYNAADNGFSKLLRIFLYKAEHLEEFHLHCERLEGKIIDLDENDLNLRNLTDMNKLKKLSLSFNRVYNDADNGFLKFLIITLCRTKNLEDLFFECKDLGDSLVDGNRNANVIQGTNSFYTNLRNIRSLNKLKKLSFEIYSSNEIVENNFLTPPHIILNGVRSLEEFSFQCSELGDAAMNLMNYDAINNLKMLSLNFFTMNRSGHLLNFINQQPNLKVLNLIIENNLPEEAGYIPHETVSFVLDKLTLDVKNADESALLSFILTQAVHLVELELRNVSSANIYNTIFQKCKTLKKLTIDEEGNSLLSSFEFQNISLDNLRHFEVKETKNPTNAKNLFQMFPYIESLKCSEIYHGSIANSHLTRLYIDYVLSHDLRNFIVPNLQDITIGKLATCDNYWPEFVEQIKNVENLTIKSLSNKDDVQRIIATLPKCEKLKKFKLRHIVGLPGSTGYNIDEDEKIGENIKFYKILIDTDEKTVKISSYILRKCSNVMQELKSIYEDFEFIEFCF